MKRPTPRFDRWLRNAQRSLRRRGAKAELARHLSDCYGRPPRSWEANLGQIIGRKLLPNAETLLAIDDWIGRQLRRRKQRVQRKKT
jgi:hypothetical protein